MPSERRSLSLTLEGNVQHTANVGQFSFVTTGLGQVFRDEDDQLYTLAEEVTEGSGSVNNAADQSTTDFHRSVANYGFLDGHAESLPFNQVYTNNKLNKFDPVLAQ